MPRIPMRVEDCRYRRTGAHPNAAPTFHCGLLEEILGVDDPRFSGVARDACDACCASFPPTADEINPVVASFLYRATAEIVRCGGVAGCDLARAQEIQQQAFVNMPSEGDLLETPAGRSNGVRGETLAQIIPAPAERHGAWVRNWAVGVTTAPRQVPTLDRCLDSLADAGWDRPRLFVDGPVDIPERFASLPRTSREPRVGAWPSYFLALSELLMREPRADAYLLVQDDAIFAAGLGVRDYLEQVLWPGRRPGVVSLFCSRAYTQATPGWVPMRKHWVLGALAFVFARELAVEFIADLEVVRHRTSRERDGLAGIDWCVGRWSLRRGFPVYFPTPSLVQHIGDTSTIGPGQRALGNRRASWFASR